MHAYSWHHNECLADKQHDNTHVNQALVACSRDQRLDLEQKALVLDELYNCRNIEQEK